MINRSFTKLWTGNLISQFGDRVTELALPLIAVATLAATPFQVGLLTAAVSAPNLSPMPRPASGTACATSSGIPT